MRNNKNGAQAEIGNQLHMIHSHSCDPFGFAHVVHIIEVSRPRTLHCVVCVTYAHAPLRRQTNEHFKGTSEGVAL